MDTNQSKSGANEDRTSRALQKTLDLITQAGETVATKDYSAQAGQSDDNSKDHWDKSHKLATLTTQRSGGWLQTLALIVSGIGCALAGYAAIIATIQSRTAYQALVVARDALKIGQRPYVEAVLPDKFEFSPGLGGDIKETFKNYGNTVARLQSVCVRITAIGSVQSQSDQGACIPGQGKYNFRDSDLFKGQDRYIDLEASSFVLSGKIIQLYTSTEYKDQENNLFIKHTCGIYVLSSNSSYIAANHCSAWNDTIEVRHDMLPQPPAQAPSHASSGAPV